MKIITKNLIRFAIVFTIGAIVFRYGLSHFLTNHWFNQVWIIAVVYFFFNLGIGWFYGKKDYETLPLFDIGFRFHFTTYLLFNIVSELWYHFGYPSQFESIKSIHQTAIFWGIGLIVHFIVYLIVRNRTISGIERSEIFE